MINGNYESYKDKLRKLLVRMDASTSEAGMPMLDAFVKDYEESLYKEVGRLTRQLHDSLTTFATEEKIFSLAKEDIPGAKERLGYVVTVTEQAAQNVLSIVEKSIPVSLAIGEKASELHGECEKISDGNTSKEDVADFLGTIRVFLSDTKRDSDLLQGHLTEILMAQEYQDITGQIIKKVICLVQDVEDSLVELVRMTGYKQSSSEKPQVDTGVSGPHVPGVDGQSDHVADQDDVDHLLASLGF